MVLESLHPEDGAPGAAPPDASHLSASLSVLRSVLLVASILFYLLLLVLLLRLRFLSPE